MHYFRRNIGDYHKKAGRLSMLEHGAYTLLIDACYDREQFPTLEQAIDWCWARTDEEKQAVEFVLSKFFTLEDGKYVQNRITEEIEKYHANSKTNQRIAQEREERRRAEKERSEHEACTNRHLTNNHKPITTNQEPVKTKKAAPSSQVSLPEWIGNDSFEAFIEHRKKLKAPMTQLAQTRLIAELSRLREDGNEPHAVLDQSILNGWKGVFPLKQQQAGAPAGSKAARQQKDKEWLDELTGRTKRDIIDITPT